MSVKMKLLINHKYTIILWINDTYKDDPMVY